MANDLRHVVSDAPRVMVVDGSKLVRKLIGDTLLRELPGTEVIGCAGIAEARETLAKGAVDLVTTALVLPDGDGLALARSVREAQGQAYVPVIVVSGNAQEMLESRASPKTSPTTSTSRWATVRWPRSSAATCSRRRSRARASCTSRTAGWWRWRPSACWNDRTCRYCMS
jgi:CheY-like chemotaxis protein